MFCKLFYYLPEGIKEEVYNYRALDKHHESIEDKVTERMDICNDPNQDVSALRHDVKFYMVTIKHHTQSTKARVQDIALYSAGGKSEGFPSEISTICSICLSPLQARLSTAYKSKKKLSGNQHQGPGIDGKRVIKSSREKIRQAQKETPLGRYDTASKYKAKLVIDAALNNAPTTEVHRSVVAAIKKRKSEGGSAPTSKNVCFKKAGNLREEAQLAISKQAMTNRPLSLATTDL